MGFIDWHGNKQDHYEDVLEFAKMKEQTEADNFGSQMKRKADADLFGVPELISKETDEILILLLKEKKSLDLLYGTLVSNAPGIDRLGVDTETAKYFYNDFLRYSIDVLFQQAKIEEVRIHKFVGVVSARIFKLNNSVSLEEHYSRVKTSQEYRQYLSRSYELKSGNATLFWQWIQYLSELSAKSTERDKFVRLYQRFMMHLAYYINQLLPDADVGKKYAKRRNTNDEVLKKSLAQKLDPNRVGDDLPNPIFRLRKEEEQRRKAEEERKRRMEQEAIAAAAEREARRLAELEARRNAEREAEARRRQAEMEAERSRKRLLEIEEQKRKVEEELALRHAQEAAVAALEQEARRIADLEAQRRAELDAALRRQQAELEAEERRRKYISLVKWARVIPGLYILDIEDEKDMVTAGRLYTAIKDKEIQLERMTSMFPAELARLVENRTIPTISPYEAGFRLNDQELLHYMEYATIYTQGPGEEQILSAEGTLFITNHRIRLTTARKEYNIPFGYLKKAAVYDVMPEIIEFASADENYFVRTANTELTYQLAKLILNHYDSVDPQNEPDPVNMAQISIRFLENADLPAFIFGIRTMIDAGMPENLYTDLCEMVRSLEYLDLALTKYPSHKDSADSFFTYYIPEAVKILYSYNEYTKAGLANSELRLVYEKVVAAVQQLAVAAKQQVVEIYKREILDTTARANALADLLGQDGFVDSIYKIHL